MDILLFVLSSLLVLLWLDKRSKVATIVYTSGSIIFLVFFMFVSNSVFVSNLMQMIFDKYYFPIKNALNYAVSFAYFGFNALIILQLYGFVMLFVGSFILFKKAIKTLKKVKCKVKCFNFQSKQKRNNSIIKHFSLNKIFLCYCKLLN